MLVVLKEGKWWVKGPNDLMNRSNDYWTKEVKKGLYLITNNWCKQNIKLSKNNKSDSVIKRQDVYRMIQESIINKTFIQLPDVKKKYIIKRIFYIHN